MLTRRDKRVIAAAAALFLISQPVIFASIPLDTDDTVKPVVVKKGTHLRDVARLLEEQDLIRSSWLFVGCSLVAHRGKIIAGEYELSKQMSIAQIAARMAAGQRKVYTLKIVEGYNLNTVGEALEKAGIMNRNAFFKLATDDAFLDKLRIPADTLEGYFYPDTYFYSKETDIDVFLEKIIRRTFAFFEKEDIKARMVELHMSPYDVLTLASMIEKEAKIEEEKPLISAVFHNRLQNGMSLDSDPTVMYGISMSPKALTRVDLDRPTAYNTYRLKGLPKGPICNPSTSSLLAALYPAPSDFLYFVSRNDGTHVFSRRISEHNQFVTIYQKNKKKQ
jgi:peptidoglycan lytic transglycosylase G